MTHSHRNPTKKDLNAEGHRRAYTQPIPVSDPKRTYTQHSEEISTAIERVLSSGVYIGGDEVQSFERDFATYLGSAHVLGVGSGTEAIELALRTCGVGQGDYVATVSLTAVGTIAAIELVGATPIFVDIDPERFTLDPDSLENLLERSQVKAIIPVHLYGQPANMIRIMELAAHYGVIVIEDCAQAHGASINSKKCGTWGTIGAYSFYPTKNLGAFGDGGAVVINAPELVERALLLREYGWRERQVSEIPGMNSRLDAIQAAILRVKLKYLDRDNSRRQDIARRYEKVLKNTKITPPSTKHGTSHVFHQYVIRTSRRDTVKEHLIQNGIMTAIHYPQPIHLQPAYRNRLPVHGKSLPHTECACKEVLSLPCFPELSDTEVNEVVNSLLSCQELLTAKGEI